jgi:hypothetical protein
MTIIPYDIAFHSMIESLELPIWKEWDQKTQIASRFRAL